MRTVLSGLMIGIAMLSMACKPGQQAMKQEFNETINLLIELASEVSPEKLIADFPKLEIENRVNRTKNEWLCTYYSDKRESEEILKLLKDKDYVVKAEVQKRPTTKN